MVSSQTAVLCQTVIVARHSILHRIARYDRKAIFGPAKHMSGMWKADVGGDPTALHSLVRILKRALRFSGGPSGTADTGQVPSQLQFPHRWRRCDGTKERVELEQRRSLVSPSLRRVLLRRHCHWMLTWV